MKLGCLSRPTISSCLARTLVGALPLAMVFTFAIVAGPAAQAQSYKVIHSFTGGNDGANPYAGVTIDAAGNLYGTAFQGGSSGYGTVFTLRNAGTNWILTPLHSFTGGSDGAFPAGTITLAPDGSLYGTTYEGGGTDCYGYGYGTVFQLTLLPAVPKSAVSPWNENVLFRFIGPGSGENPAGNLTFDQSGNIYGTTGSGGSQSCGSNSGVIFELRQAGSGWIENVLYTPASPGGEQIRPSSGVIFDRSGNLYGVSWGGGPLGQGTVYQLSPSGSSWTARTIYTFTGGSDGVHPTGGLIPDSSGNLYGTTQSGGTGGGGTVFQLTPTNGAWTFNTLYSFSGCNGCAGPEAKLTMDVTGNLYGTTYSEGAYGWGTVFKLARSSGGWSYTSLYDFTGGADGGGSWGALIFDRAGNLYGTTLFGGGIFGANGYGVVFEITP